MVESCDWETYKMFCVCTPSLPPFHNSTYSVNWLYTHTVVKEQTSILFQELKVF